MAILAWSGLWSNKGMCGDPGGTRVIRLVIAYTKMQGGFDSLLRFAHSPCSMAHANNV